MRTTCPRLLRKSATAETRTRDLLYMSREFNVHHQAMGLGNSFVTPSFTKLFLLRELILWCFSLAGFQNIFFNSVSTPLHFLVCLRPTHGHNQQILDVFLIRRKLVVDGYRGSVQNNFGLEVACGRSGCGTLDDGRGRHWRVFGDWRQHRSPQNDRRAASAAASGRSPRHLARRCRRASGGGRGVLTVQYDVMHPGRRRQRPASDAFSGFQKVVCIPRYLLPKVCQRKVHHLYDRFTIG